MHTLTPAENGRTKNLLNWWRSLTPGGFNEHRHPSLAAAKIDLGQRATLLLPMSRQGKNFSRRDRSSRIKLRAAMAWP